MDETEARIQHALERLLRGRTSFVIAHRLSTIRHADLVLVMEDGRIVERGTAVGVLRWRLPPGPGMTPDIDPQ